MLDPTIDYVSPDTFTAKVSRLRCEDDENMNNNLPTWIMAEYKNMDGFKERIQLFYEDSACITLAIEVATHFRTFH